MAENEAGTNTQTTTEQSDAGVQNVQPQTNDGAAQDIQATDNAEIARLRAQLHQQKAALDKATKEADDNKRALRARQTAEEAAAEAEQERQAAIEKELNELRKERAVANASKRVMAFVQDEATATSIAETLYGAADIDLAIDTISKAWTAKEKALRAEFGKIPAPSIGSTDGPTITKAQLDNMGYKDRLDFSQKHPDEYRKLMGR